MQKSAATISDINELRKTFQTTDLNRSKNPPKTTAADQEMLEDDPLADPDYNGNQDEQSDSSNGAIRHRQ